MRCEVVTHSTDYRRVDCQVRQGKISWTLIVGGDWLAGARVNLPVHDGLQDGGKGRNSDTSPYKNGVLCPVEVAGGTPKWSVYVNLEG